MCPGTVIDPGVVPFEVVQDRGDQDGHEGQRHARRFEWTADQEAPRAAELAVEHQERHRTQAEAQDEHEREQVGTIEVVPVPLCGEQDYAEEGTRHADQQRDVPNPIDDR